MGVMNVSIFEQSPKCAEFVPCGLMKRLSAIICWTLSRVSNKKCGGQNFDYFVISLGRIEINGVFSFGRVTDPDFLWAYGQ